MAENITFQNPNPAIGKQGTLVTAQWFQNTQDEIANVITDNGGQIDPTKSNQLSQTLTTKFAPLNSPTFTGTPLVPDTNSTSNGKQIVNFESMQAYVNAGTLGYTPVHQGGGAGQGTNSVYIGWSGSYLKAQVDSTDLGNFAFQDWCNTTFLSLTGGNVTGTFTYNGTTVATKNDVNNAETDIKNWTNGLINSNITLSGQYNFNTSGYTQWYRQASNATDGIIDFYSNYGSTNHNCARITSDGTYYSTAGGGLNLDNPYATSGTSGGYNASPAIEFQMSGRGAYATLRYEELVGRTNQLTLAMPSYNNNGGNTTCFWFDGPSGRINSSFGEFAFISDLNNVQNNLQNQINGKQAAGSYVTADQYAGDFATGDSRVINLAWGHRLQVFVVAISGSGTHDIVFPVGFSSVPQTIVISNGLTDGRNSPVSVLGGWTATGFQIQTNGSTSVNFLAIGPK